MSKAPPGNTLQETALLHEAFLRCADQVHNGMLEVSHFVRAIRLSFADHARSRMAKKRGGGWGRVGSADEIANAIERRDEDTAVEDLLEALDKLRKVSPEKAEVVDLRFFVGLRTCEIAERLGQSEATVERRWRRARAMLYLMLSGERGGGRSQKGGM